MVKDNTTTVQLTNMKPTAVITYNNPHEHLGVPNLGLPLEVSHVQLQTSIDLPNYFATTQTLNHHKVPGVKMYLYQQWLIVIYKEKVAMTPSANVTSLVLK